MYYIVIYTIKKFMIMKNIADTETAKIVLQNVFILKSFLLSASYVGTLPTYPWPN